MEQTRTTRNDAQGGAAFLDALRDSFDASALLTSDDDLQRYGADWTGAFKTKPVAVLRPADTEAVSRAVTICAEHAVAVVPQSGRTGLCGGGVPVEGQPSVVLSLERMNAVRRIDPDARTMTAEAGVILEQAQARALDHDMIFPLTFGAQGSAMLGGALSTNAGGSNVVKYGTTRELCIGIEAVMPDGSIVNALTGLRKDNTGYDLRDLLIGAEGTLGIITAAVFKLSPKPRVRVAAFLALADLADAPQVLNRLQDQSGNGVEAFEYMPEAAVEVICRAFPAIRPPLDEPADHGIFVEVASTRSDDAEIGEDGSSRLGQQVLTLLGDLLEENILVDAMVAQSESQRNQLWHMRESILEAITANGPALHTDISLPLAEIANFVGTMDAAVRDMGFVPLTVGHLGDGNLHYTLAAASDRDWDDLPVSRAKEMIFDRLRELSGSFSAEHGIGQSKLDLMRKMKEQSQISVMQDIKRALDPQCIMNPGKLVPRD